MTATQHRQQEAQDFADAHQLELCTSAGDRHELQLCFAADRVCLFDVSLDSSIAVDFVAGSLAHRQRFGGGRGQPLARAIGLNKFAAPRVVDATAGLARDAFVLASLGCRMTLLEQSPVLHQLVADGVARALAVDSNNPVQQFAQLLCTDSMTWLQSLAAKDYPEVIYLDPMYPPRQKSALVKKDMQMLHKLIGYDDQSGDLLALARQRCSRRVAVKRPASAPPLANMAPNSQISSKNTRYDLYVSTLAGAG